MKSKLILASAQSSVSDSQVDLFVVHIDRENVLANYLRPDKPGVCYVQLLLRNSLAHQM